ncbi:MAG: PadR family transcriptional regulator [Lysobacteraceae bacterium]|nr:MAG: PadR family transcriptional regulator [Xanthomonadaceae bacterium]
MAHDRRPSKQMVALLTAMSGHPAGWRHGYELMKDTGVSSGTLYPLLIRMTEQGLLEAEWREPSQVGRPPRHAYRLTTAGISLARTVATGGTASSARLARI